MQNKIAKFFMKNYCVSNRNFVKFIQQDLMRHLELQKFQNSEDQKTILELSGRLQELQNEVNFMNDSKDFMDAESTCSGNPHVTSPPGLFPKHPPLEGLLKPAFKTQRQDEEPPNIWDTFGISGNVLQIHKLLRQLRILRN